jgi:hypothetical protein
MQWCLDGCFRGWGTDIMNKTRQFTLFASVFALLGVSSAFAAPRVRPGFSSQGLVGMHEILVPTRGGREPINAANRPAKLHPELRGRFLSLEEGPASGETTRDIFPSSWWPMTEDGIAARWRTRSVDYEELTARDDLSPAEKYDLLFYPGDARRIPARRVFTLEEMRRPVRERGQGILRPAITVVGPTTEWELLNHGNYQATIPEAWWGHCNGWSSYVTAEQNGVPLRDVRVRRENGRIVECRGNGEGCVLFRTADIEGLFSEVYFHDASTMAGVRCNTEEAKIERDEHGRPTDTACRDMNPGTFHVAMTGLIGRGLPSLANLGGPREKLPFVVDYSANNEVWTFPVVKYAIRANEAISEADATELVCNGTGPAAPCNRYRWNENASRFARIRASYFVVNYAAQGEALLLPPLSRPRPLAETTVHYVLELDGRGNILGGEWIESPTGVGPNSKVLHPDFMFMSVFPDASDEDNDDRGGRGDNPFISYNAIKEILRISRNQNR